MVLHGYNLSNWQVKAGGYQVQGLPQLHSDNSFENKEFPKRRDSTISQCQWIRPMALGVGPELAPQNFAFTLFCQ